MPNIHICIGNKSNKILQETVICILENLSCGHPNNFLFEPQYETGPLQYNQLR